MTERDTRRQTSIQTKIRASGFLSPTFERPTTLSAKLVDFRSRDWSGAIRAVYLIYGYILHAHIDQVHCVEKVWKREAMGGRNSTVKYEITVQTWKKSHPGYNEVNLTIVGSSNRTHEIQLKKFKDDVPNEKAFTFKTKAADVGTMQAIKLRLRSGDHWHAGVVTVSKRRDEQVFFPCYHCVIPDSEMTVIRKNSTLPFQDNEQFKKLRDDTIHNWRDLLPWHEREGIPNYSSCPDLPADLEFSTYKKIDMGLESVEGVFNMLMEDTADCFVSVIKTLSDYKTLFDSKCFPKSKLHDSNPLRVVDDWKKDESFGRQFLQGVHPTTLFCVTESMPEKFPVTSELVEPFLEGKTLQEAIESRSIYMVDYEVLRNVPLSEGRFVTPAMGLFYVNAASKSLLPVAIQLRQEPATSYPIWTPNDSEDDWLWAKMWLRCADAQIHEVHSHLLLTHLVMEPVATALLRNVARCHPLFKLLIPHMRYTLAINRLARKALIDKGGFVDKGMSIGGSHMQFLKKRYDTFNWQQLNFPETLKQRQVDDAEKLPNYYYRDDALKLWNAIQSFLEEVVKIYYKSDDDVKRDEELKNLIKDLHDNGFPSDSAEIVPDSLNTRSELIEWLTCVVFCSSAQHAAQNFGQFEYYAFNPNAPMLMRQPPPEKKGEANSEKILKSLGSVNDASLQITVTWLLASFSRDEVYLGDYSHSHFTEDETLSAISKHQEELKKIEKEIDARNEQAAVPYIYLKPSRVPNSIAV
eukprot:m.220380 g.220380  ORF g.220380 m.220380 type:complete len:749 (+) comp39936_c2_seq4:1023-3269(+)